MKKRSEFRGGVMGGGGGCNSGGQVGGLSVERIVRRG